MRVSVYASGAWMTAAAPTHWQASARPTHQPSNCTITGCGCWTYAGGCAARTSSEPTRGESVAGCSRHDIEAAVRAVHARYPGPVAELLAGELAVFDHTVAGTSGPGGLLERVVHHLINGQTRPTRPLPEEARHERGRQDQGYGAPDRDDALRRSDTPGSGPRRV